MSDKLEKVGSTWLSKALKALSSEVEFLTPVEFTEKYRYLTSAMSPMPGLQEFESFPFWIEPLNRLAPWDPAREIYVMKGVQVGFNISLLEPAIMYVMAQLKSAPSMLITADNSMAKDRWDVYILPSLLASGFDIIRSHDSKNPRKTGQTSSKIEHEGGGVLYLLGAVNQNKMRSKPIRYLFMDEISGWKTTGNQGDSVELIKARTDSFEEEKKIFGGSTPLLLPDDAAHTNFMRGDQRYYNVRCTSCSFPQVLNMKRNHLETGKEYGIHFETEKGLLVVESVRFKCANCGHEHFEKDKPSLFSLNEGAEWVPTARATTPHCVSYHLSSWYSPFGIKSWARNVQQFLDCYDIEKKKVKNIKAFQTFYNNVLGLPFDAHTGGKVKFEQVSRQRRTYSRGTVPSLFCKESTGDDVLFVTCGVDIQKAFVAAIVIGMTTNGRAFAIDYHHFDRHRPDEDCRDRSHPVWGQLKNLITKSEYLSDTGNKYRIMTTFVDANDGNSYDSVVNFCSQFQSGVYPIVGRGNNSGMTSDLGTFTTKWGTSGVKIFVNPYKMRVLTSLRRWWVPENGSQEVNALNLPVDFSDSEINELTKEEIREDKTKTGHDRFVFHRTGDNEMLDCTVYALAAADFRAWQINDAVLQQEQMNMELFHAFARNKENDSYFARELC